MSGHSSRSLSPPPYEEKQSDIIDAWLRQSPISSSVQQAAIPDIPLPITFQMTGFPNSKVLLTFTVGKNPKDIPLNVVFVIDGSGSMDNEMPMPEGAVEGKGSSRHNLTLHTLKTCILMFRACDTVSVIIFSSQITILFKSLCATEDNKKEMISKLDEVYKRMPNEYTQTSAALKAAFNLFSVSDDIQDGQNSVNNVIILLTDGVASDFPSTANMLASLDQTFQTHQDVALYPIGFGVDCNDEQLSALANSSGGLMWFIPDITMVGVVSVNLMTTILSSVSVRGNINSDKLVAPIKFDSIKEGCVRQIVVDKNAFKNYSELLAHGKSISFVVTLGNKKVNLIAQFLEYDQKSNEFNHDQIRQFIATSKLLSLIGDILENSKTSVSFRANQSRLIGAAKSLATELSNAGFQDIADDIIHGEAHLGQLCKALNSADTFYNWGIKWIRSFWFSHSTQTKMGRNEQSPRIYSTDQMKKLELKGNNLYDTLPAGVPTYAHRHFKIEVIQAKVASGGYSYSQVNDQERGCFHADSMISTPSGSKKVSDLKKNDAVYSINTDKQLVVVKIVCVIQTNSTSSVTVCELPSRDGNKPLIITPTHPVKTSVDAMWQHPKSIVKSSSKVSTVYNLILESNHIVILNGYIVCTMGHGITDNDIISHPFFGTDKVTQAYKSQFPTEYENGLITVNGNAEFVRDSEGYVIDIRFE
jgi:hypothetical protein